MWRHMTSGPRASPLSHIYERVFLHFSYSTVFIRIFSFPFSWVFGEFLCRMYQFVHSLSYTASIFILVVICMERYFAIVHPITCKQILTAARLRVSYRVYPARAYPGTIRLCVIRFYSLRNKWLTQMSIVT